MEAAERYKIAESLRKLADLVDDGGSVSTVDIETERVGYMVKTSVVLWSVAPDAVPASVQWCTEQRWGVRGRGVPCGTLLSTDGTCGNARHHIAVVGKRW